MTSPPASELNTTYPDRSILIWIGVGIAMLVLGLSLGHLIRPESAGKKLASEGSWRATNVIAVFDFVQTCVLIVTLMLIYYTLKASFATLALTRGALEETQRSTAAAERGARAAEEAERAHVFTEMAVAGDDEDAGVRGCVLPAIRNFGQTPAIDCAVEILWSEDERWPIESNRNFKDSIRETDHVKSELATVGPTQHTAAIVAPLARVGPDGKCRFWSVRYYVIDITYKDVFKKNHRVIQQIRVVQGNPVQSEIKTFLMY